MQSQDFQVGQLRERFAVGMCRVEFTKRNESRDVAFAQQLKDVWDQGHIAPIADVVRHSAFEDVILYTSRSDGTVQCGCRCKQRRFEREDGVASRTGAFREKNNEFAALQGRLNLLARSRRVETSAPIHKDGSSESGESAENRPTLNISLGHERGGRKRAENDDIQVTEMVADQQAAAGNGATSYHAQIEDAKKTTATDLEPTRAIPDEKERQSSQSKFGDEPDGAEDSHVRNFWRTIAGNVSKSSSVRKSMVLNVRSSAGGPQILAPIER